MKKCKVDVEASLRYQENGRLTPAENKEYAKSKLKKVVCPNCNFEKEVSRLIFGQQLHCPNCNTIMLEQY